MKNQKWDACIDCGSEKTKQQRKRPRCNRCAAYERQSRPGTREKQSAIKKEAYRSVEARAKTGSCTRAAMSHPDVKEKLSAVAKVCQNLPDVRIRQSLAHGGDGDLARIERWRSRKKVYDTSDIALWSKAVRARDGYCCQHCRALDRRQLHAHHIKPRAMFPELSLDLDNGITLCKECHVKEHRRLRSLGSQPQDSF